MGYVIYLLNALYHYSSPDLLLIKGNQLSEDDVGTLRTHISANAYTTARGSARPTVDFFYRREDYKPLYSLLYNIV